MAEKGSWLRIAHRGASGTCPEHTRPAFERAVQLGVDMIELDVQLTRDEQLVVLHDYTLERTTSGTGAVRDRSMDELRALDSGSWFSAEFAHEPVMSLPEVLAITANHTRLNVEIKAGAEDWAALVPRLLAVLQEYDALEGTVISCFELGALQAVRDLSDAVRVGVLWHLPDLEEAWRWCREVKATSIHPFWVLAGQELMSVARDRHLQVLAWTVNDEVDMHRLVTSGVGGIISDFPERFASVR